VEGGERGAGGLKDRAGRVGGFLGLGLRLPLGTEWVLIGARLFRISKFKVASFPSI